MNKLADFQVLECTGRWHQSANDPGRDVIVRIDDLILTLIGKDDRAIVTWTCDAIRRINPDGGPAAPAIYSPDSEGQETISITDETMISVLDNIISNFAGPEIKPGVTLRGFLLILGLGAVIVAIIALFSDNLASQLAGLVPAKERRVVGERVLSSFLDNRGRECASAGQPGPLGRLGERLFPDGEFELYVVEGESVRSLIIPGSILILGSSLLEEFDGPELVAGQALAEAVAARSSDPFGVFLKSAGLIAAANLVLGNGAHDEVVDEFARWVPVTGPSQLDEAELLAEFERAGFSSAPYASSLGSNGALANQDPYPERYEPLMSDEEWLRLRDVCLN